MTHPATLKIACLHGYCQNAQIFRRKTAALRKSLQRTIPMAELYYIDAPFVLEQSPNSPPNTFNATFRPLPLSTSAEAPSDSAKRSWWVTETDGKNCQGWSQSLHYLQNIFREKQFHGILGFSQGAIVVSLISALTSHSQPAHPQFSSLRFAIMVSGYPARPLELHNLYHVPIPLPSMHIWGVDDNIVPPSASRRLLEKFHDHHRNCIVHPKGHLVPSDANSRRAITNFVLTFSQQLTDSHEQPLRAAL